MVSKSACLAGSVLLMVNSGKVGIWLGGMRRVKSECSFFYSKPPIGVTRFSRDENAEPPFPLEVRMNALPSNQHSKHRLIRNDCNTYSQHTAGKKK